jgi:hypothetical protein
LQRSLLNKLVRRPIHQRLLKSKVWRKMPHQKVNATNAAAVIAMVVSAVNVMVSVMVIAQSVLSVQLTNLLRPTRMMALLRRHPCKLSLSIHAEMLLQLQQQLQLKQL